MTHWRGGSPRSARRPS